MTASAQRNDTTRDNTEGPALYIRLTAPPVGEQFHGLTLEVIDPATGNTLIGALAQFFGQTFGPVGTFTVPAGGNLLIRVRGSGTFGDEFTTAPYEFFVQRGGQ